MVVSPTAGTYALQCHVHRLSEYQFWTECAGTFRNLCQNPPGPATATCTGTILNLPKLQPATFRNPPEPPGTRQNPPDRPEPSGTLRNLPKPSRSFGNPPEPACHQHRHTPEPIYAEDPISFRCWRNNSKDTRENRIEDGVENRIENRLENGIENRIEDL